MIYSRKWRFGAVFSFDSTGTGSNDVEAQLQSILQMYDLFPSGALDEASVAQTQSKRIESSQYAVSILSEAKEMNVR